MQREVGACHTQLPKPHLQSNTKILFKICLRCHIDHLIAPIAHLTTSIAYQIPHITVDLTALGELFQWTSRSHLS